MLKFVGKRVGMMIISLFIIILITFIMMHSVPGGPFTRDRELPEKVEQALNEKYKLDDPLPVQFFDYIKGLVRFDLGPSFKYQGKTVNDFIENGFPISAKLGAVTLIFIIITAIPLGIWSALKNGRWQDGAIMLIATLGVTIPSFVVATLLLYVFSYQLNLLPTFGLDSWQSYILPVIALGGYSMAFIARLMRSSLLEVMGQDYIRTARSKGLSETQVVVKHGLRNALIPVVTILGPTVAGLLTGSFVIEKIFAIPGMGVHFVDSVGQRDYTAIMGITIFYATFLLVMTFIVDLFYLIIDPRIKLD
ncbi:MAG: ABC transporter permease [Saccharofermentanales bacterium]|jgi:oligopeptide transport system permease protein